MFHTSRLFCAAASLNVVACLRVDAYSGLHDVNTASLDPALGEGFGRHEEARQLMSSSLLETHSNMQTNTSSSPLFECFGCCQRRADRREWREERARLALPKESLVQRMKKDEWHKDGNPNSRIRKWVAYCAAQWRGEVPRTPDCVASGYDTSRVTDFDKLFTVDEWPIEEFNEDISGWDTSSVVTMAWTFFELKSFNQILNRWDVSNVVNFEATFFDAKSFSDIGIIQIWNLHRRAVVLDMFCGANAFKQRLTSKWLQIGEVQRRNWLAKDAFNIVADADKSSRYLADVLIDLQRSAGAREPQEVGYE